MFVPIYMGMCIYICGHKHFSLQIKYVCVCTFLYVCIKMMNVYFLTSVEIRYSLSFRQSMHETGFAAEEYFCVTTEQIKSVHSDTVLAFLDLRFLIS